MTRTRSGRAPGGDDPRSHRRRDARSADRGRSGASETTVGRRVTPKSDDADRRGARRGRLVRVAAIAFAVLLVVAMAVGCAKYDGDQAAFCAQLEEVPTFMELSAKVNAGSDTEAAATMKEASEQFRALERVAPRSIRDTVAKLGDSAERIEANIGSGSESTQYVTLQNDDGTTQQIPITTSSSQARLGVFYDEMENHHGTVSALYSLMSYGRDDCGITDHELDLGMFGYGPSEAFGSGFGTDDDRGPGPAIQVPSQSPGQEPARVVPSPGFDRSGGDRPSPTVSLPGETMVPPATAAPRD